jgi:hypothetical protein
MADRGLQGLLQRPRTSRHRHGECYFLVTDTEDDAGVVPGRALYFSVYTFCKENASEFTVSSHIVHIAAAAAAGVTSQTVLSPIYVIKTRLQVPVLSGSRVLH